MRCDLVWMFANKYDPLKIGQASISFHCPRLIQVKVYQAMSIMTHGLTRDDLSQGQVNLV